jgi:lipopolysaccharide transport system permease protein
VYGVAPTAAVILLPVWIVSAIAVALSVGIVLAALNVQYRDVRYALPFLLQLWFFASPVVYSSSVVHGAGRWIYSLNPMVAVVDGFRWSAVGGATPQATALASLGAWIVLTSFGLAYFSRVEHRFADQI